MIKLQAVNDTIIILKDSGEQTSPIIIPKQESQSMYEIPEPFTGVIDSVGEENEWKPGDHVAFSDMGPVYIKLEDKEYVVVVPQMIIGKF